MGAVALDKKRLCRDIAREERKQTRAKLAELRLQLRAARTERAAAIVVAKERCRTERLAARERARALRIRGLAELREATRLERANARDTCSASKSAARSLDAVRRRRAELAAEAAYQAELRAIERANRVRTKNHPHATYVERRGQSDDEVRANISQDLLALWEKVKRSIKGSPRMTRTASPAAAMFCTPTTMRAGRRLRGKAGSSGPVLRPRLAGVLTVGGACSRSCSRFRFRSLSPSAQ
jgi:hypothetical protein